MHRPLARYRVLDASTYLLGPFAAMMLADLGADVIKVEAPGGDPYRRIGPRRQGIGLRAAVVNRGKRTVAADLKTDDGRARFLDLVGTADVVLHNWRPGVAERLGLSDAVLAAANPRLVRLWLTGYGATGPLAGRPAFDTLLQAQTGLAHVQGYPGRPAVLRTYVADKVTATFAAQAVLAALLERESTGSGCLVELSMLEAMAYFNFPDVCLHRLLVNESDSEPLPPPSTIVPTADGAIVVSPVSGQQVRAALAAVGHPEWWGDLKGLSRYADLAPLLVERLSGCTRGRSTDDCLAAFAAHDVPAAPVLDPDGHLADPQVRALRIYEEFDDPGLGRVRFARYPVRAIASATRPSPAPGEQTDDVLRPRERSVR